MKAALIVFVILIIGFMVLSAKSYTTETKAHLTEAKQILKGEHCAPDGKINVEIDGRVFSLPRVSGIGIVLENKSTVWDIDKPQHSLACEQQKVKNSLGIVFSSSALEKKFHASITKPGYFISTTEEKYREAVKKDKHRQEDTTTVAPNVLKHQISPGLLYYEILREGVSSGSNGNIFVQCWTSASQGGTCSVIYKDATGLMLAYNFSVTTSKEMPHDFGYKEEELPLLDDEVRQVLKGIVGY